MGGILKVGNMGTAISETKLMDKWAASKHTQVSAIFCIKLLPLLSNCCLCYQTAPSTKLKIWTLSKAPPTLWPHHQCTNKTGQKTIHMDLPPALLTCRLQPKTHCRPQKQRFGCPRLSKKFVPTPTKTDSSQGHSSKGQPTPCKTRDAFPRSPLGYRVLATHLATPSHQPSPATKPAKFAPTRKWAGPVMPKGQLSRVPWPGSCRILFTFQAVLRSLQQTHKHSCSLHLAIHTQIAHRYIQ